MGYFIDTLWAEKSYLIPVLALGIILLQCGITHNLSAFKAFGIAFCGLILGVLWALFTLEDMGAVVGLFIAGGGFFVLYILASLCFGRADRKKTRLSQRRALLMILGGLLLIGLTVFAVNYDKVVALRLKLLANDNNAAKFAEVLKANADMDYYPLEDLWEDLIRLPPNAERLSMIKMIQDQNCFGPDFDLTAEELLAFSPSPARTKLIKMIMAEECRSELDGAVSSFDFAVYKSFAAQGDYEAASALVPCFIDKTLRDGEYAQLESLLKNGADPNMHRGDWTPLAEACRSNKTKAIELLLKAGASREDAGEYCAGKLPAAEKMR